jgi:hypothetical protein
MLSRLTINLRSVQAAILTCKASAGLSPAPIRSSGRAFCCPRVLASSEEREGLADEQAVWPTVAAALVLVLGRED